MAGDWAIRAVKAGDQSLLSGYDQECRELFGEAFERAVKRRALLEQEWDRLEEIIKSCWVVFREYYE